MPPRYDTAREPCPLGQRGWGQACGMGLTLSESWGQGKLQSLVREGHREMHSTFPIPFLGCYR